MPFAKLGWSDPGKERQGETVPAEPIPAEYERHCVGVLVGLGWKAQMIRGGRDRGFDVIAERGEVRLIVQCKRSLQPLGEIPVRDAHAVCCLYAGTVACLVAPAGFTDAARQEADALDVRLLHHSELEELDRWLRDTLSGQANLRSAAGEESFGTNAPSSPRHRARR